MSSVSRRAALVGTGALAGTAIVGAAAIALNADEDRASPPAADQVSPELLALIEAHKRAWSAFGDTCEGADPDSTKYAGEQGRGRWQTASDSEEACLAEIVAYPSTGPADNRAKGEYFRDMDAEFGGYADAIIDRLLSA